MIERGQAVFTAHVASCDLTRLLTRLNMTVMSKEKNAGPSVPIIFAVVFGIQGQCHEFGKSKRKHSLLN